MPTLKKGETQAEFIKRCIPYVMDKEGIEDSKHAYAKCRGIYKQEKKKVKRGSNS